MRRNDGTAHGKALATTMERLSQPMPEFSKMPAGEEKSKSHADFESRIGNGQDSSSTEVLMQEQGKPAEDSPAKGVSLKRMCEIIGADRLQRELKKVLGEPKSPRLESRARMTMPPGAKAKDWLKRNFRKIALGIAVANPVLPWAILDGWVQTDHPFLQGRFEKSDNDEPDGDNHATHVAGTVIGVDIFNFNGRNYNIFPKNVFAGSEKVLMAIRKAADDGALATTNSWSSGTDPEDPIVTLFQKLAKDGIHHNIAAGNFGENGSDTINAPGIAFYFTDLVINGKTIGKVKRIKTIAAADENMKPGDFSSLGPGSLTTALDPEKYNDYPSKPDEAGIGVKLVAPVPQDSKDAEFVPELGGLGRRMNGTSMSTPGDFGGFLLLTRSILVLLKDYLPSLAEKRLKLFAMDLARYSMTMTAKKVASAMEQGDGFIDVWAAFEHAAALLKATNTRILPRVRETFRAMAGLGGYGKSLVERMRAWLNDPGRAAVGSEARIKPPIAAQRFIHKFKLNATATALAHSSDGRFAFFSSFDNTVRKIDAQTGSQAWSFDRPVGMPNALLLSKDDRFVFIGGDDNVIRVLDAETGQELNKFGGSAVFRRGVKTLATSLDGESLFVGCGDGSLHLLDIQTGLIRRFGEGHARNISILAVLPSPDGRHLFTSAADKTARMWDVSTLQETRKFDVKDDWIHSLAVSPDGKRLFTGSKRARLWDVESGEELPRPFSWSGGGTVWSMLLSQDGKHLFTGLEDKTVLMWNVETGKKEALFRGHEGAIAAMDMDADRRVLITAGSDSKLAFWNIPEIAPDQQPQEPLKPQEPDTDLEKMPSAPEPEKEDPGPEKNAQTGAQQAIGLAGNSADAPSTQGTRFIAAAKETLRTLSSAREEAGFMDAHGVEVRLVGPGEVSDIDSNDIVAAFSPADQGRDAAVYFNRAFLDRILSSLIRQGVPENEAPAIAGRLLAPLIAHELRHGITDAQMRETIGMPVPDNFLENEILSYMAQAKVTAELLERFPQLRAHPVPSTAKLSETLLDAMKRGPEGIGEYVRKEYKAFAPSSILETTTQSLLADIREYVQMMRDAIARAQKAWGILRTASSEELRQFAIIELSQFPPLKELLSSLSKSEQMERLYATPDLTDKLRGLFRSEIARLASPRTEDWNERLIPGWVDGLRTMPSTQEHFKFLQDHALAFHIVSGKERGSGRWVAQYEAGNIYINKTVLDEVRRSLIEDGTKPEELDSILILKTLPYMAHELRHAMTEAELQSSLGMPLEIPLIEYEILGHADQIKALAEIRDAHPGLDDSYAPFLDDMNNVLLDAWATKQDTLGLVVRSVYKVPPATASQDWMLERAQKLLRTAREGLSDIRELQETLAKETDPAKRTELEDDLRQMPPEQVLRQQERKLLGATAFFSRPGMGLKLREFYQAKLAALREEWNQEEWQAWRGRWQSDHAKRHKIPEYQDNNPMPF